MSAGTAAYSLLATADLAKKNVLDLPSGALWEVNFATQTMPSGRSGRGMLASLTISSSCSMELRKKKKNQFRRQQPITQPKKATELTSRFPIGFDFSQAAPVLLT